MKKMNKILITIVFAFVFLLSGNVSAQECQLATAEPDAVGNAYFWGGSGNTYTNNQIEAGNDYCVCRYLDAALDQGDPNAKPSYWDNDIKSCVEYNSDWPNIKRRGNNPGNYWYYLEGPTPYQYRKAQELCNILARTYNPYDCMQWGWINPAVNQYPWEGTCGIKYLPKGGFCTGYFALEQPFCHDHYAGGYWLGAGTKIDCLSPNEHIGSGVCNGGDWAGAGSVQCTLEECKTDNDNDGYLGCPTANFDGRSTTTPISGFPELVVNRRTVTYGPPQDCDDNDQRAGIIRYALLSDAQANYFLDPSYIADTLKNRHFRPSKPITPFDNIMVKLQFGPGGACNWTWDPQPGAIISVYANGVLLGYKALSAFPKQKIVIAKGTGYNITIGNIADLLSNDANAMDQLINAVANKQRIYLRISEIDAINKKEVYKDIDLQMTNCVHLAGEAAHKFVFLTGKSPQISIAALTNAASGIIGSEFGKLNPFAKYNQSFSFYIDLKQIDDSTWNRKKGYTVVAFDQEIASVTAGSNLNIKSSDFELDIQVDSINNDSVSLSLKDTNFTLPTGQTATISNTNPDIKIALSIVSLDPGSSVVLHIKVTEPEYFFNIDPHSAVVVPSSCAGVGEKYYFLNNRTCLYNCLGYTARKGEVIFLTYPRATQHVGATIHETGHALCDLADEYHQIPLRAELINDPKFLEEFKRIYLGTNCVLNPLIDYKFNNIMYGDSGPNSREGCAQNILGYLTKEMTDKDLIKIYRPSVESLMSAKLNMGFNVISCGYCTAAIKGGSASSYWPECMTFNDTIKPVTTTSPKGIKVLPGSTTTS
jgi:hypothetical protein